MATFTFGAAIPLNPIRLQREADERKAEQMHNDFSHHAYPARAMMDVAQVRAIIQCPHMTDTQMKAFEIAMNDAFSTFQAQFEYQLRQLEGQE